MIIRILIIKTIKKTYNNIYKNGNNLDDNNNQLNENYKIISAKKLDL